jgi:hypothetical protein
MIVSSVAVASVAGYAPTPVSGGFLLWVDKGKTQGFGGVPKNVWNFYIGGYHVCEKWLKDRIGLVLSAEDIFHYQRIVVAMNEIISLMEEIDKVIEAHGGWPEAFTTSLHP